MVEVRQKKIKYNAHCSQVTGKLHCRSMRCSTVNHIFEFQSSDLAIYNTKLLQKKISCHVWKFVTFIIMLSGLCSLGHVPLVSLFRS